MKTKKYLVVKKSKSGLGLFTEKPIKRGDFIIEYTGEKISHEEADRRNGKYLFTLDKKTVVDGKGRENTARYINHSCRPNAYAEIDEDKRKIFIYAKRAIKEGEEVSCNYGKGYWEDHIGTKNCTCEKCTSR
jgi:hypothetical protein